MGFRANGMQLSMNNVSNDDDDGDGEREDAERNLQWNGMEYICDKSLFFFHEKKYIFLK